MEILVSVSTEERRSRADGRDVSSLPSGPRADDGPSPRPSRRSFSSEYKLRIVAEYEAAPNGEKGAVLRREGLYSSHVIEWTRARDAGALAGVTDSRRSPKRPKRSAERAELERLRDPGIPQAEPPPGHSACRAGDVLVVTKLDRLARPLPDAP